MPVIDLKPPVPEVTRLLDGVRDDQRHGNLGKPP
jgi:hypothetical protein